MKFESVWLYFTQDVVVQLSSKLIRVERNSIPDFYFLFFYVMIDKFIYIIYLTILYLKFYFLLSEQP